MNKNIEISKREIFLSENLGKSLLTRYETPGSPPRALKWFNNPPGPPPCMGPWHLAYSLSFDFLLLVNPLIKSLVRGLNILILLIKVVYV